MRLRSAVLSGAFVMLWTMLLFSAGIAQALVIPLSTKQLCDYSQTIVVATVDSTEAAWTGVPDAPETLEGTIVTDVHLRVLEVLKGNPKAEFQIRVLGGHVGDTTVTFTDAPVFSSGHSYVIFLDSANRVVGWREGGLEISRGRVDAKSASLRSFERQIMAITGAAMTEVTHGQLKAIRSMNSVSFAPSSAGRAGLSKPKPSITKITPKQASSGTGSKVTITGSSFGAKRTSGARVTFLGRALKRVEAAVERWGDKQIVCFVPEDVSSGDVTVRNAWGRTSEGALFLVSFGYGGRRWQSQSCTYRINANGKDSVGAREMVLAAFATWNDAGAEFSFIPEGDATCATAAYRVDGHNDLFWSSAFPEGVGPSTVARTVKQPPEGGSTITEFDIWFNDTLKWGDGSPGTYDVQSVATHELGHAFGLADLYGVGDRGKVMGGGIDPGMQRRTPTLADKAGIQWIYGKKTPAASGQIAFVRDGSIWVINADGTGERQLTHSSSDELPSWSPDGGSIAFVRATDDSPGEIRIIDADGGNEHQVAFPLGLSQMPGTEHAQTDYRISAVAWSPDGSDLAVAGHAYSDYPDVASGINETQLFFVGPDGSSQRRIGPLLRGWTERLSWRADGAKLLLTQYYTQGVSLVSAIDVTTTSYSKVQSNVYLTFAAWSSEGASIAAGCAKGLGDIGASADLVVFTAMNGQLTKLLTVKRDGAWTRLYPCWSPDDKWLALAVEDGFDYGDHAAPDLELVALAGGKSSLLAENADQPAWRPE